MTGRRYILGLCTLCALVLSAVFGQTAMAGQTAFTCVPTASPQFASDHCVAGDFGTKTFGHVGITEETSAKISNAKTSIATAQRTSSIFKETIAATNLELESAGVIEGLGTLKNEEIGGEMRGTLTTDPNGIVFNEVVVKAPAGKGCVVREHLSGPVGVIRTKPLKASTTVVIDKENGEGFASERHSVVVEPTVGTAFATFWMECEKGKGVPEVLEGAWEVTGNINCPTHGATINCNHATITEAATLKGKGAKAGLSGKVTTSAGKFATELHPVAFTTTTP